MEHVDLMGPAALSSLSQQVFVVLHHREHQQCLLIRTFSATMIDMSDYQTRVDRNEVWNITLTNVHARRIDRFVRYVMAVKSNYPSTPVNVKYWGANKRKHADAAT
jgi:hypothetical protein